MAEFGAYVHVPFCSSRCDYCAFATWTDRSHLVEEYVDACVREIALAREAESLPPATSVFFGGGTPSLIPADELCRILASLEIAAGAEITVECNPETLTAGLLRTYRRAGVTRISIGVQSMLPHVLECLGRWHDPASVIRGVELVGDEDFASFNVDLIYGATAESDDDWRRTLDAVLELSPRPPHVSAYGLTVEPGTALWRDPERHPDDDVQAGRYETADAVLRSAGLDWYEVSNWSVAGHGCRHNALYWGQDDYRGFGCAAHSHRRGNRFWNIRTPERYIAAVTDAVPGAVRPALAGEELLGAEERRFESLELALRTRGGVPRDALAGAMAAEPALAALLEPRGERLVLTLAGRLLANEVAIRLDTSERSPTASAGTRSEMC